MCCSATASSSAFNTGGTVRLLGFTLTVPENLQVGFPATFVPWKDFVANKDKFRGYEMDVGFFSPFLLLRKYYERVY
jgi:hypothetical protein